MVSWSTVAVLALTSVVYGAFCVAVARAFLARRADRVSYRLAAAWAACFAVTAAGSLATADAFGVDAAALFAAAACGASWLLCLTFGRWQRNREMAAAVAYLQMCRAASVATHDTADEPAASWAASPEAVGARLARTYDLTRREEDVLLLLMAGCTFAEAADELVVSLNTVKSHVRRIYAKMGVNGKADLLEKVSSAI